MLDAIRRLVDNGTKWRAMPAGFPPWDRVYASFRRRRNHGEGAVSGRPQGDGPQPAHRTR
ncbi:transposase [Streptomyces sp. NPDC059957]|uniref:transposase n=1 Tax=unclassified Streptomyces TaxID=2593676 RepID=UPI003649DD55